MNYIIGDKMEKEVKIYVRKTCPFCNKLLKILDQQRIKYTKYDIEATPAVRSTIITRDNHTPVPQAEMPGRTIFDYTTEEYLAEEIKAYLQS